MFEAGKPVIDFRYLKTTSRIRFMLHVAFLQNAFDHEKARSTGVILPKPGEIWVG